MKVKRKRESGTKTKKNSFLTFQLFDSSKMNEK